MFSGIILDENKNTNYPSAMPSIHEFVYDFFVTSFEPVSLFKRLRDSLMKKTLFTLLFAPLLSLAQAPVTGLWRASLATHGGELPIQFEIRQTQAAISPFVAGWNRMVLVLPAYIGDMSEQQRQLLIDHELTHLQRRDPQQLLLLRILVALCWFNPVLRLIEQAFIRSMELAVDKAVLQKQPEQALLYGQTLLCSLKQSQAEQMPALMPGFIQSNASQSFYQQRLQQLFQPAPVLSFWQKWRATAVLCSTALLLNVGCAQLSFSSPPQEWLLPVGKVPINSFYGEKHPFRKNRPHQGLDFGAKRGATVKAAQKGKVLIADAKSLNDRYGKAVLIDHGHGYQTLYAHLDDFYIEAGQTVEPGQPIGKVGSTGRVTGPHLHFELLVDGKQQDPTPYLKL